MGSNPVGASEFFLGFICNCLVTSQLRRSLSLLFKTIHSSFSFFQVADYDVGKLSSDRPTSARNCSKCAPGHGVIIHCTNETNTICAPCVPGVSFSRYVSSKPCRPCSSCHDDEYEVVRCSRKSNTVCRKCSACQPGFGVVQSCRRRFDTVCGVCPNSDEDRSPCQPCTDCAARIPQGVFGKEEISVGSGSSERVNLDGEGEGNIWRRD